VNIEEDVKIDKNNLAVECADAAETYYYYAKELGIAKTNLDISKTNLDAVIAKKQLYYRMTPPDGLKVTETVVSSAVDNDTDVQNARHTVDKSQATVNLLYSAVMALGEKSSRLKDLVSLNNRDYYNSQDPSADMHDRLLK